MTQDFTDGHMIGARNYLEDSVKVGEDVQRVRMAVWHLYHVIEKLLPTYLESQAAPQETTVCNCRLKGNLAKYHEVSCPVYLAWLDGTPTTTDAPACEHMIAGNHSRD